MKEGFTLVELSIVLVIIGLLIGGILVGQSLISSAKISAFISQTQQFDAAVNNFKTKYKQLPGDAKSLNVLADNDGLIEDGLIICCGATYTNEYKGENENFWPMLQISGFKIPGISSQLPMSTIWASAGKPVNINSGTQNTPKMPSGNYTAAVPYAVTQDVASGLGAFGPGTVTLANPLTKGNFYFFADFRQTVTDNTYQISATGNAIRRWADSIPVEHAQAIDSKIDDGKPNAGTIYNASYYTSSCWPSGGTSSGKYNVNSSGLCSLLVRMPDK